MTNQDWPPDYPYHRVTGRKRRGCLPIVLVAIILAGLLTSPFVFRADAYPVSSGQRAADDSARWMARTVGATPAPLTFHITPPSLLMYADGAEMLCGTGRVHIGPTRWAEWSGMFANRRYLVIDMGAAQLVLHELAHGISGASCDPNANTEQDEGIVEAAALSLVAPWSSRFLEFSMPPSKPSGLYGPATRRIRQIAVTATGSRNPSRPVAKRYIWRLLLADQAGRDSMIGEW